jgi:antitoxin ParD1/3/4
MPVTITLPESLKAFIDAEVASGGYPDASGYVQELLLKESRRQKERERIEALLEEGLNSGEPTEWTAQSLERHKRELTERHAQRNGKTP